jgi:hypothetical protein
MGRACSRHEEMINEYTLLVGKPEGKRPLGRPRCISGDNIRVDLRGTEWEDLN